jgi:hypothetical protein
MPHRSLTALMSSARLGACRSPAVPIAVMATTPLRRASSIIAAMASTVRRIAPSVSRPDSASPSPIRVISARSATVETSPSACRQRGRT